MRNLFNQIFTGILVIGLVFTLNLFSAQNAMAQTEVKPPYLPKLKDSNEVKELAKFAENLAEFYTLGDAIAKINTGPGTADPDKALLDKFFKAGGKIISEDRPVGAYSQKIVQRLNEFISSSGNSQGIEKVRAELKQEVEKLLSSRYVRPAFSQLTTVLASAALDTDDRRIGKDTGTIIEKPLKLGFYKPKFSCAVLAAAIFAAELRNSNKTAATVDSFFKSVCNAASPLR